MDTKKRRPIERRNHHLRGMIDLTSSSPKSASSSKIASTTRTPLNHNKTCKLSVCESFSSNDEPYLPSSQFSMGESRDVTWKMGDESPVVCKKKRKPIDIMKWDNYHGLKTEKNKAYDNLKNLLQAEELRNILDSKTIEPNSSLTQNMNKNSYNKKHSKSDIKSSQSFKKKPNQISNIFEANNRLESQRDDDLSRLLDDSANDLLLHSTQVVENKLKKPSANSSTILSSSPSSDSSLTVNVECKISNDNEDCISLKSSKLFIRSKSSCSLIVNYDSEMSDTGLKKLEQQNLYKPANINDSKITNRKNSVIDLSTLPLQSTSKENENKYEQHKQQFVRHKSMPSPSASNLSSDSKVLSKFPSSDNSTIYLNQKPKSISSLISNPALSLGSTELIDGNELRSKFYGHPLDSLGSSESPISSLCSREFIDDFVKGSKFYGHPLNSLGSSESPLSSLCSREFIDDFVKGSKFYGHPLDSLGSSESPISSLRSREFTDDFVKGFRFGKHRGDGLSSPERTISSLCSREFSDDFVEGSKFNGHPLVSLYSSESSISSSCSREFTDDFFEGRKQSFKEELNRKRKEASERLRRKQAAKQQQLAFTLKNGQKNN